MKKLYKSLIALILILSMFLCIGSVFAIDELNDLPTSGINDFWENELKPIIFGLGGGIGSFILFLLKARRNRKEDKNFINQIAQTLGLSKEQTTNIQNNYDVITNKIDSLVNDKIKAYMEKTNVIMDKVEALTDKYEKFEEFVSKTIEQTNINDDKIIKTLQIAFINHPTLVSDGSATAIKRVLKNEV